VKQSTVRGTPVRHVSNTTFEGIAPGKPKGYSGTVNKQFEGDQKGNRQEGVAKGTPYNSDAGNSDEFSRTRASGLYGDVRSNKNLDMADPASTGNGVLFNIHGREEGYSPVGDRTMDSPVHEGAPEFQTRNIRQENLAHLGQGIGASPSQAADVLLEIGGVMSRGMQGTSSRDGGEDELLEDDVLQNLGAGGASDEGSRSEKNSPSRRSEGDRTQEPKEIKTSYHPPK